MTKARITIRISSFLYEIFLHRYTKRQWPHKEICPRKDKSKEFRKEKALIKGRYTASSEGIASKITESRNKMIERKL